MKLLTIKEAAERVRCSVAHLCNLTHGKVRGAPRLPVIELGRRRMISEDSLYDYLAKVEAKVEQEATEARLE
jgi:excisionase family DNA binding protein